MSHNGIDIDQYILLIIYPSIAFFAIGFITKKINIKKTIIYILQSIVCFSFSIAYYLMIPFGGAQGLSVILALFGILLIFLARKERISPEQTSSEVRDAVDDQRPGRSIGGRRVSGAVRDTTNLIGMNKEETEREEEKKNNVAIKELDEREEEKTLEDKRG